MQVTALVPYRGLADSLAELFDTIDAEPIAALLAEYQARRATLARVASIFTDADMAAVLPYFIEGNKANDRYSGTAVAAELFKLEGAVSALNADYWGRALNVTDVLECMPAKRRDDWHKQIAARDVPEFTEAALRSTLAEHLAARPRYFAERVDGLFRSLSPEHVTNLPTGFRSKLILNYVFDSCGSVSSSSVDTLADLRVIVARFMGRVDLGDGSYAVRRLTRTVLEHARREQRGEWVALDGNAIEVRCYKAGTCHVRVHEEIAWRLNGVLAYLHPDAIPESARTRPKRGSTKKAPTVELVMRPLPFAVLRTLEELLDSNSRSYGSGIARGVWSHAYGWDAVDKHVRAEVDTVIASLGGTVDGDGKGYHFDYDASEVVRELIVSGVVPDQRAHQFYPTPRWLAEQVVALAEIGLDHRVLEPSAGQGGLADLIPRGATPDEGPQIVCVEASALHCAVLRAKNYHAVNGDFLDASLVADAHGNKLSAYHIDRVVMNPPFDRGQWRAHVEHAAKMLPARGARLVAVLPASAPSKPPAMPGFTLTWSEPIAGAFAGTNVVIVLLTAVKQD